MNGASTGFRPLLAENSKRHRRPGQAQGEMDIGRRAGCSADLDALPGFRSLGGGQNTPTEEETGRAEHPTRHFLPGFQGCAAMISPQALARSVRKVSPSLFLPLPRSWEDDFSHATSALAQRRSSVPPQDMVRGAPHPPRGGREEAKMCNGAARDGACS